MGQRWEVGEVEKRGMQCGTAASPAVQGRQAATSGAGQAGSHQRAAQRQSSAHAAATTLQVAQREGALRLLLRIQVVPSLVGNRHGGRDGTCRGSSEGRGSAVSGGGSIRGGGGAGAASGGDPAAADRSRIASRAMPSCPGSAPRASASELPECCAAPSRSSPTRGCRWCRCALITLLQGTKARQAALEACMEAGAAGAHAGGDRRPRWHPRIARSCGS